MRRPQSIAVPALAVALAGAALGGLWWAIAGEPLLGEDHAHLADVETWPTPAPAFASDRLPARPLQWLLLWGNWSAGLRDPAGARLSAFAFEFAALALLVLWLRGLGVSPWVGLLATVLVLLAPAHIDLVWLVAAMRPLRRLVTIAAAWAWWRHVQAPSVRTGAVTSACTLFALLAHEGAVTLLPILVLAWVVAHGRGGLAMAARDPWTWVVSGLVIWRLVDLFWLRAQHQHDLSSLGAMAANSARAVLGYLPQSIRLPWLDALRGTYGALGTWAGLAGLLGLAFFAAQWWRRGTALERFCLLVVGFEPIPAVLATGVSIHSFYVAIPFFAVALGLHLHRARGVARITLWTATIALAASWLVDSVAEVRAFRESGVIVRDLVTQIGAVRARVGPEVPLVIADLPGAWGSHDQVPMLAWGAHATLARSGVYGPLRFVRTRAYQTTTEMTWLDDEAWQACRREARGPVLQWDPGTRRVVELR